MKEEEERGEKEKMREASAAIAALLIGILVNGLSSANADTDPSDG